MGGGQQQSSQPTSQTITSNPIADWAQPTATALIGSQMQNAYNIDSNGNIISSKGFTPFGGATNAQGQFTGSPESQAQYNQQLATAGLGVAGPSALQNQSYQGAAGLQTPGAYGQAQQAAGYGAGQAFNMANSANPQDFQNQVGGYMNPYMQQVLAPQLQLLNQQYGQQQAQQQGQATQAGAFGGGRDAVMQGLNNQNQLLATNQLTGNALNNAFNQAQNQYNQTNQFGLQANQAGVQNAGTQANIAGQGLQAQQGILSLQNQMGAQQQQNQQNVINQAMQNYGNQQNYGTTQATNIMNLLRSTPTTQTQTQYQAPPNVISQVGGLAATGLGAYGAAGGFKPNAKGGAIKEKKMAVGGIADSVKNDLYQLADADPNAFKKQIASASSQEEKKLGQEVARDEGIPMAKGGKIFESMASGGIVAFAKGGDPTDAVADMAKYETPDQSTLNQFYASNAPGTPAPIAQEQPAQANAAPQQDPNMLAIALKSKDAGTAYLDAIRNSQPDQTQQMFARLMQFGGNLAGGTSSNALTNIGAAAKETAPGFAQDIKDRQAAQLAQAKAQYDISNTDSATLMEIAKNASQDREKEKDRLMHLGMSKQQAEATITASINHANATVESAKLGLQGHMAQVGATKANTAEIAKDRLTATYTNAYTTTYNNIVKSMQDKLGIDKVTPEQYAKARELARDAATDARNFATGQNVIKLD